MSYENLEAAVNQAAKRFLELGPIATADVSGGSGDTIFTMDATGLSEGMYALDYFPSGTTILIIGGVAPTNTVEFSAGKNTSGTDSVRFSTDANGVEGLGLVSGTSIAWPGVSFTPPSDAAYATVEKLPISSMPVTLGVGGEDDEKGILQLSLYFPSHLGEGALRAAVGKTKRYFTAGSTSTYSGAVARFQHAKNSPFFRDDARLCCHVSIYWHGRTTRPSPTHNT